MTVWERAQKSHQQRDTGVSFHGLPESLGRGINSRMNIVTLDAHIEGDRICLDEPFEFPPGAKLKVTVFTDEDATLEAERQGWRAASQAAFARCYGEEEPDYSNAVILERPPRE